MNGAESLVRTLVTNGVNVCLTNPGTSEMHFVAALDKVEGMRCVLGLFEGVVTGSAIAAPDRKVVALEGDGSGMYTLQALWTMARENLDVTVIVLANRSYQILHSELRNMGAGTPGQRAVDMLSLDRPHLDWVALARGHGVEGARATTLDELALQLGRAFSRRGPYLIELAL